MREISLKRAFIAANCIPSQAVGRDDFLGQAIHQLDTFDVSRV